MKTAMQELIEWVETRDMRDYQNKYAFRQGIVIKLKQALKKEKEQSINLIKQTAMFMAASSLDEDIAKMSYEDVYNSYYNQNE